MVFTFSDFANDNTEDQITTASAVRPKIAYSFTAQSTAHVFLRTVELMIEEGYLTCVE